MNNNTLSTTGGIKRAAPCAETIRRPRKSSRKTSHLKADLSSSKWSKNAEENYIRDSIRKGVPPQELVDVEGYDPKHVNKILGNMKGGHNGTESQGSTPLKEIPSRNFPPGCLCWHTPSDGTKDPCWPAIVVSSESIFGTDFYSGVYNWFCCEELSRSPRSLLLYYLGTEDFGVAVSGEWDLIKWENHDPLDQNANIFLRMKRWKKKTFDTAIQNGRQLKSMTLEGRLKAIILSPESSGNSNTTQLQVDHPSESAKQISSVRCEICSSLYDVNMMLLCDKCNRGVHVYCSCYALIDAFKVETDEWLCQFCKEGNIHTDPCEDSKNPTDSPNVPPPEEADEIYDTRCIGPLYQPEFFSKKKMRFVQGSMLPDTVIASFFASVFLRRSLSRAQLGGTPVVPEDHHIVIANNLEYRVRKWRYLNGTYIGITQILDYFTPVQICGFERDANTILRCVESGTHWLPESEEERAAAPAIAYLRTLDKNEQRKRLKLFLGYRYAYGRTKTNSRIFKDVDPIKNVPLVETLRAHIEDGLGLVPKGFIDQSVMNYYLAKNSCLGVHQDEKRLFHRPICSVRLFSDSVLSFGCKGFGMQETPNFIPIPQSRGTITLMEGWAANNMVHCIRSRDIKEKSLSIIFRKVTDRAVREMQQADVAFGATEGLGHEVLAMV